MIYADCMKNRTTRNVIIFSIVVLLSGWIGHYIDQNIPAQSGEETPGMGLWLILPLVTTALLRAFAGDGWKDIGLKPRLATNFKWYIVSILIFPLVTAIVLFIGWLSGWISFSNFRMEGYMALFATALVPSFIKNIFEEFVWRGYLTSKLASLKLRDTWIYLVVGLIWGAWHIPYYLFFLPEAQIYQILPVDRLVFALIAIVAMIAWTIMFVEIYLVTRSIWPVVVLHMIEDSVINHLVIDQHITIAPGKEMFVSPIVGVVPMTIYIVVGFILRGIRKQKLTGY